MSLQKNEKLKNLLDKWPSGTVATSSWLEKLSISRQLAQRYKHSRWIEPLGRGAYRRPHDKIEWYGALTSLQQQAHLAVHVGGPTAISLQGASHYLRMEEEVFLFSQHNVDLPKWFTEYDWGRSINHVKTSMLPSALGVKDYNCQGMKIKTSSLERAALECLYLSPRQFDLMECYQIIEGLMNLRPSVVQDLLVNCNSVRVKRLFLYMAEKARLPVLRRLKLDKIDLGKGSRSIVKDGIHNAKYGISLPKELVDYA